MSHVRRACSCTSRCQRLARFNSNDQDDHIPWHTQSAFHLSVPSRQRSQHIDPRHSLSHQRKDAPIMTTPSLMRTMRCMPSRTSRNIKAKRVIFTNFIAHNCLKPIKIGSKSLVSSIVGERNRYVLLQGSAARTRQTTQQQEQDKQHIKSHEQHSKNPKQHSKNKTSTHTS